MHQERSITELLKESALILGAAGIPEPRREASSLLELATGLSRTQIISSPERVIEPTQLTVFSEYLSRRAAREPFHYIAGRKEFFGLEFLVDRRVLIPRPETEVLVEKALEILEKVQNPQFCEIGIGSGCISISILKNLPDASAIGLDISTDALEVALSNAEKHLVSNRLELIESDIFSAIPADVRFDAIVSNPPYISISDMPNLEPEVVDHEPNLALTDGASGITLVEKIIFEAEVLLKPGGFIAIEIGHDQSERVAQLFSSKTWDSIHFLKDLQGHDRVACATKRPSSASN